MIYNYINLKLRYNIYMKHIKIIIINKINKKEMSENNEDTQDQLYLKQELLRSEIIAKNYDGQKFLEYCVNLKENGDDMNNWTYDELKSVVENFKGDYDLKKEKKEEQKKKEIKEEIKKEKEKETHEGNIDTEKLDEVNPKKEEENNNINKSPQLNQEISDKVLKEVITEEIQKEKTKYESRIKELPCKLLEKSILNNKEIKVTIKDPKTNEKSLLSQGYTNYEVFTEPSCWSVRRRYSDFTLLRNLLCKFYPRYFIPPLPEKKIGGKRFQPNFIEKRMKILQIFMDEITCNETFKANDALVSFLSMGDHNTFEKKMKELNSKSFNQTFEDIKTLNGHVKILQQDNKSDKYLSRVSIFYKNQKQIFIKLSNSLKNFYRNTQTVCQNLEEISKSFEELESLNKVMKINEEILKSYEMLKLFFQEWKRIKENENEIIHDKIKGFFKIQKLKTNSFIEIFESRETLRQKYYTENTKLLSKKEKLYTSTKDVNKWEINEKEKFDMSLLLRDKNYAFSIMCSKDNQAIESIKNLLELCNYNFFTAFKNLNKEYVKTFVENMKKFAELIYPLLDDGLKIGNKLKSYI